jgi:hypothetical protein
MTDLFQNICVDNFFKEPYQILDLEKKVKYNEIREISGSRSEDIKNIDYNLFNYINKRIIQFIFPGLENIQFKAETRFQKSTPDPNDGWVHFDHGWITAIIYLTPEGTSGTSIWEPKKEFYIPNQPDKHNYFENKKNYSEIDKKLIHHSKIVNNSNYEKTIQYSGKFNRMICFDALKFHAADVLEKGKDRKIIISFIKYINTGLFPGREAFVNE